MRKLVQGIGINEQKFPSGSIDKVKVKEYSLWIDMLLRCTQKYWTKKPTYTGTTCSENFKSYSYFYEWCQTQIGFDNKEENGRSWQLDKDLLGKNSKTYSEGVCIFIPQDINSILVKRDNDRGEYPVGVCLDKRRGLFKSRCCKGAKEAKWLGYYDTPEQAFQAYKTFKEAYIKQVAEQYKSQIDPRAYEALMKYEVHIDD
jgi:hypothetical protein